MKELFWKGSEKNLIEHVQQHSRKSSFNDVIIICKDGEEVTAHKLILCSRISFFKRIFIENERSLILQPTIIMPDLSKRELESVLQFIYQGSVLLEEKDKIIFQAVLNSIGVKENEYIHKERNIKFSKTEKLVKTKLKIEEQRTKNESSQLAENSDQEANDNHDDPGFDPVTEDIDIDDAAADKHLEEISVKKQPLNLEAKQTPKKRKYDEELGSFMCPYCGVVVTMRKTLKKHIQNKHEGIRYPCDQCAYQGTSRENLKHHKDVYHEMKRYYCDQCSHVSASKSSLRFHIKSIHMNVKYPCDMCDHQATQLANLRKHKDSVHFGIKHECDMCDMKFSTQSQMKKHQRNKHGKDTRVYQTSARDVKLLDKMLQDENC